MGNETFNWDGLTTILTHYILYIISHRLFRLKGDLKYFREKEIGCVHGKKYFTKITKGYTKRNIKYIKPQKRETYPWSKPLESTVTMFSRRNQKFRLLQLSNYTSPLKTMQNEVLISSYRALRYVILLNTNKRSEQARFQTYNWGPEGHLVAFEQQMIVITWETTRTIVY